MELSRLLRCAIQFEDLRPLRPSPALIDSRLRRMEHSRLLRCAREDLNLHGLPRYHLKVVRLPVSPRARERRE